MNRNEWIALAPLIVLVVALGVYPGPVLEMIAAPVDRIIDAVNGAGLTALRAAVVRRDDRWTTSTTSSRSSRS